MAHQKEVGVFVAVTRLVDQFSDNPAAGWQRRRLRGGWGGRRERGSWA